MPGLFKKKIDFDTYELPEPEKEDYVSEDSEAEEIDSVMLSMKGLFTFFSTVCLKVPLKSCITCQKLSENSFLTLSFSPR